MDKELWDWLSNNDHLSEDELQTALKKRFPRRSDLEENQEYDTRAIEEVQTWWDELRHTNHGLFYELISDYSDQFPVNEELIGSDLGVYTLLELIGEGGMGRVFLAERNDGVFDRKVAIKLMKFSLSTEHLSKRFEQEQRILASLNHASIAQLYDASVTQLGAPYFVMERVEGTPLNKFIKEYQPGIKKLLKLFIQICEGVEHAHKNLVIHKDLKPGNILVDSNGYPKILDFGISDFVQDIAEPNVSQPFTLAYASPEIIQNNQVNTATDIFSLGIILAEILSGKRPFNDENQTKEERLENIEAANPALLLQNEVQSGIAKELGAIILKAIAFNPDDRYSTVTDLKQDIERVLQNRPISLLESKGLYTSKKWIQRNASFAVLSAVILFGSIIFATIYVTQISKERALALEGAKKANVTKEYLLGLFEMADPLNKPGEEQSVREFLNLGIQNLSELDTEPEIKEDASYTLAQVAFNLGEYEASDSLFRLSFSINKQLFREPTVQQSNILDWQANIKKQQGNFRASKKLAENSFAIKKDLVSSDDPSLEISYSLLGTSYIRLEMLDSATFYLDKAKEIVFLNPEMDQTRIIALTELSATLSRQQEDYERSVTLLKTLLELIKNDPKGKERELATAYNNLGFSYRQLGNYEMAVAAYDSSLQILKRVFGDTHPNTFTVMGNLAGSLISSEDFDRAEKVYLNRLDNVRSHFGGTHWRTGQAYFGLGGIYQKTNRLDDAQKSYQSSVDIYSKSLGERHFWTDRARLFYSSTLPNETKAQELFSETLASIKSSLTQPLSYYDFGGLEQLLEVLKSRDQERLAGELLSFIDWYEAEFDG